MAFRLPSIVAVVLLAATGCPESRREREAATDAVAPPRTAAVDARAVSSSTTPAPPREGAPGSTRGTIACGTTRCLAESQACVFAGGSWTCIPDVDVPTIAAERSFQCDNPSDCAPAGRTSGRKDMTCCTYQGKGENARCLPRASSDDDACDMEVCSQDEGAAACPKGQSCADGFCRPTSPPRATCTGGAKCPPDAPVCRWERGAGACITRSESEALVARLSDETASDLPSAFACTKPNDCGIGHTCCSHVGLGGIPLDSSKPRVTECRNACDGQTFVGLCTANSDCPWVLATGQNGGMKRARCAVLPPSPRGPAWVGMCEVAGP